MKVNLFILILSSFIRSEDLFVIDSENFISNFQYEGLEAFTSQYKYVLVCFNKLRTRKQKGL